MILRRIIKQPWLINPLEDYAEMMKVPVTRNPEKKKGVSLMAVHKSKGLQSRIVIILNVDKDIYGFPCELQNPDVFEPAVIGAMHDRLEEERRLFYVAVTRGIEEVIIYNQKSAESKFINEIKHLLKIEELHY
jgi:DNA helicase-4